MVGWGCLARKELELWLRSGVGDIEKSDEGPFGAVAALKVRLPALESLLDKTGRVCVDATAGAVVAMRGLVAPEFLHFPISMLVPSSEITRNTISLSGTYFSKCAHIHNGQILLGGRGSNCRFPSLSQASLSILKGFGRPGGGHFSGSSTRLATSCGDGLSVGKKSLVGRPDKYNDFSCKIFGSETQGIRPSSVG